MTLRSFKEHYLITDSEVVSIQIQYANTSRGSSDTVTISFNGRKLVGANRWEMVPFSLTFQPAIHFEFSEHFTSRVIAQSTLVSLGVEGFYLSLDPYEEDKPSERDNMVVASSALYCLDEQGTKHELT